MKKEYHYTISRTDRIWLVAFVIALLAWELVKTLFPGGGKIYEYVPRATEYSKAYKKDFKKDYRNYQTKNYPRQYKSKSSPNKFPSKTDKVSIQKKLPPPYPLPIMTASINDLTSMGLTIHVAFNIQKFIAAGGILSKPEDLMKIYGMDSMQLIKASPHIIYATPPVSEGKLIPKKDNALKKGSGPLDLNTATVSDLESLNGIGNVLAERILKFRQLLGGFTHPEQLKECYGITPELFEQLKSQLSASDSFTKIRINQEDLTALSHPYLNKKMIRLVQAYMDHHGSFTGAEELKKVYPHDTTWFNKIIPYLSFEMEISDVSPR